MVRMNLMIYKAIKYCTVQRTEKITGNTIKMGSTGGFISY